MDQNAIETRPAGEGPEHGSAAEAVEESTAIDDLRAEVEALKAELAKRPFPSIDAGAGYVPAPALTTEALAKMTPDEISRLDWNDVRRVLSA